MLLVVRGDEKHKHEKVMEQLFKLRYRHLVTRRNWSIPCRDGMDIDQYDSADAVYFMSVDEAGAIIGTARLNQTAKSSLLADLFPHLIETGEDPRGPHLFEGSRFIIEPGERSRQAVCRTKSEVLSALIEWCMEHGGRDFQAVIDANMMPNFVEMSLHTRPLGLAHDYGGGIRVPGGGRCMAFRWALSGALLDDMRTYGGLDHVENVAGDLAETVH